MTEEKRNKYITIGELRKQCDKLPDIFSNCNDSDLIEKISMRYGKISFRGEGTSTIEPYINIFFKKDTRIYRENEI